MSGTSHDKPRRKRLRAYLGGLGVGVVLLLAAYCLFLVSLGVAGTLPPPPFSNNSCVDEKLRFLRNSSADDADLLVLGSSVAWRHFDGAAAARVALKSRNIAFCYNNLSQTKAVADWLLPRMPAARIVILITSPLDYQNCSSRADSQFDVQDANAYVFDGAAPFPFYFRYFDPFTLAKNAMTYRQDRSDPRQWGTLVMDQFGDAPMDPPGEARQSYGEEVGGEPDAACLSALQSLAIDVRESGRRFIVVDTPIAPAWKMKYDPEGTALRRLTEQVDQALRGTGAERWNGDAAFKPDPAGFFDAIHLRWPTAQAFTRAMICEVLALECAPS